MNEVNELRKEVERLRSIVSAQGLNPEPPDLSTFTGRLRRAVYRWGNAHTLSKALKERGTKGAAYPSVHAYLHGESAPSLEFIESAAEVVGCDPCWLAFGRGDPSA